MKRILIAVLLLIAGLSPAIPQSAPANLPYHTVYGRLGAAPGDTGPGQAIGFDQLSAQLFGSVSSQITTQRVFSTLAAFQAASVPANFTMVTTLGRLTPGDNGGATFIRTSPSTPALWRARTTDGQWWAINNRALTPEMLGCFSAGSVDCTAAFGAIATILNTFAGGYTVNFTPNAQYLVWPAGTTPAALMELTNVNGSTFNFNGAKIYTNNAFAASIGPAVFNIHNSSNLIFNDPKYECISCSGTIDHLKYGVFFYINETTAPWSNNIHVVNATDVWHSSFFLVAGDITGATQEQAHNFSVINADLQHVFYGLNFQMSGDNFFARGVKCTDCGRIYFPANVSNHDVEVIKNGGGSGFVSAILKAYALPAASDSKRSLSNIRLKYRDAQRTTIDTTAVAIGLDMQQNVPQVNVSGATNIAGVVRLTVDTTANMATGQKWFVNSVGGLTGINNLSWPVSVFDATHVDLVGSAFTGSYTSAGYLRVPAAMRDIHIQAETTLSASQPTALATYKENAIDGSPDTTVSGYDVENISFSGSLKGYNYGVPAISMFLNNGTSNGTWSGERLRNISLHDLTVTGSNSSVLIDATGVTNFELKNIYSTSTVPWTVTGTPRVQNVSATGVTDHIAVVPSTAATHFFFNGISSTTGQFTSAQPSYDDISGNIPSGTTFAGSLIGIGGGAPATPAFGNGAVWFDGSDAQLHVKNSSGTVSTTVTADTGAANNFLTAIGPGGSIFKARPTCANLSDSGVFCTGTDAANLTGALASARVSGSYTGITGVGTLTAGATGAGFTVALGTSTITGTLPCANHPALTGDVTTSAASCATTLTNAPVIAKVLTGFVSGAGTVSAADSILSALQKIDGNVALKAPLASPALTGTPTAPTAAVDTNTTQIATTAMVLAQAASATPANDAYAGVVGTSTRYARADHVHAISLTTASNTLGADVLLNNTANFFDGPSMAQGTSGTWFASGSATLTDSGGGGFFQCKLWDGTTVISSGVVPVAAASTAVMTLSGILATPAANIRISCKDASTTTGKILFNNTGTSKDATIYGFRIG